MAVVIAVVGSGGKTTRIHQLAEQYKKEGKKVFVTTTTHMYKEEGCILSGNVDEIIDRLNICGYCMAGMPAEDGKMRELPPEVYEEACKRADIVLVEADGSKGRPVKFPAEHEPVIPDNVNEIHIVIGLCAIGKPLKDVCHRKELVQKCLGVSEDEILTKEHLYTLLQKGYAEQLKKEYPDVTLKTWFNDYKRN